MTIDGTETELNPMTYTDTQTPLLTKIYPRYGSEYGGTSVTFTGTGFDPTADTEILLDDRECVITSQTDTEIVCTTSDRPYTGNDPTLSFH